MQAKQALKLLKNSPTQNAWIDVRSPSEWNDAHVPFFENIPVLTDEERHQVGLCYKTKGQIAAIDLGLTLTAEFQTQRVEAWREAALKSPSKSAIVCCWRGGLRSRLSTAKIIESGVSAESIVGGYKAMRRVLLEEIGKPERNFWIIGGFTGARKSELIEELNTHSIDLEKHARHYGSAFGVDHFSPQPNQMNFENQLGFDLFERLDHILLEDESRLIGKVVVPPVMHEKMQKSPVIWVDADIDERAKHIFEKYVLRPHQNGLPLIQLQQAHENALKGIARRLGDLNFRTMHTKLMKAYENGLDQTGLIQLIKDLLDAYYDRLYQHAFERSGREIIFKGDFASCKTWICNQLN